MTGPAVFDLSQPFQLNAGLVRGRLVRIERALDAILTPHAYPPAIAALMGQTVALAAALAGALKFDGIFTLQAQASGPVSLLVADVTSTGHLRGYARFDPSRLTPEDLANPALPAPIDTLMGKGHLAFTIDQGPNTDRYQGIVELIGPTLAHSALAYFKQSEQLDTAVELAAAQGADGRWRAAALSISKMPAGSKGGPILTAMESEDSWRRATLLTSTVGASELLDPGLAPDRLLFRLFHQEDLQCFDPKHLEAKCRCSRDRIASTLRTIPRGEIESLVDESGNVTVTCEFCQTVYAFDPQDIELVYNPPVHHHAPR